MLEKLLKGDKIVVLMLGLLLFGGCAFGKYGVAQMSYYDIMAPSGITPKTSSKVDVINVLGAPNFSVSVKGKDIWVYPNQNGFFIIAYGKVQAKDLVIEFAGDMVESFKLVDKGEAWGILAIPGAVAR